MYVRERITANRSVPRVKSNYKHERYGMVEVEWIKSLCLCTRDANHNLGQVMRHTGTEKRVIDIVILRLSVVYIVQNRHMKLELQMIMEGRTKERLQVEKLEIRVCRITSLQ